MGLGRFFSKAARAVGKIAKPFTKAVTALGSGIIDTGSFLGKSGAFLGKNAVKGLSAAAVGVGKGVSGATSAIGKVGIGKFTIGNVTKTITHAGIGPVSIAGASNALSAGIKAVTDVPVLGSIVGAATGIHLVGAVNNFARGQRLDRAAAGLVKNKINSYKAVAPYAASVVAVVPGIGTGIAAGISAGAALAEGKKWSQIAIAAAKGAIPGGAVAQAAFDVGSSIASGKPIDKIALSALPVDDRTKNAIGAGLALAKDLASGKPIDKALLARTNDALNAAGIKGAAGDVISNSADLARDLAAGKNVKQALLNRANMAIQKLGPEVAKGLQVGTAVGTAVKIQRAVEKAIGQPKALQALGEMGAACLKQNAVLRKGLAMSSSPEYKRGFTVATGIMNGKKVTEAQLIGVRRALPENAKKGFDAAAAYFIGKTEVNAKPANRRNPPIRTKRVKGKLIKASQKKANDAQKFAYFATNGLVGAGTQQKEILVKAMANASPEMREGAVDAVRAVARDRRVGPRERTFWGNMQAWLTATGPVR